MTPPPRPGGGRLTGLPRHALTLVAPVLLTMASACSRPSDPGVPVGQRLVVAASIYPLYDFARRAAGDLAEVFLLVPPGVEPHDWEPVPRDLVRLRRARVLLVNGAGLEPWIGRLAREVADHGTRVVTVTDRVTLLATQASGPGAARAGGSDAPAPGARLSEAEAVDPHVWLDPVLAQVQVEAIGAALAAADPDHAAAYAGNVAAFLARLRALDGAFESGTRTCRRREVVVAHAAFGYLTRRYRLTQIPLMGLIPDAEPSPAALAAIVRQARARTVRFVYVEPLTSPKLVEALAREIPARVLTLNPIEGLTPEEASTGKDYVRLMEENLASLRRGLDCQ